MWINNCNTAHFCKDNFENLSKVQLMGGKLLLKKGAMPEPKQQSI